MGIKSSNILCGAVAALLTVVSPAVLGAETVSCNYSKAPGISRPNPTVWSEFRIEQEDLVDMHGVCVKTKVVGGGTWTRRSCWGTPWRFITAGTWYGHWFSPERTLVYTLTMPDTDVYTLIDEPEEAGGPQWIVLWSYVWCVEQSASGTVSP